ncbi:MAG TPA: hypothetical protein VIF12_00555 [Micavibrio sp.]
MVLPLVGLLTLAPEFTAAATGIAALAMRFGNRVLPLATRVAQVSESLTSELPYIPNASNTLGRIEKAGAAAIGALTVSSPALSSAAVPVETELAPSLQRNVQPFALSR